MSKTILILATIIVFFLLTDTALERVISNGVWNVGRGAAVETQYFAKGAGTGVLGGIEGLRLELKYETTYFKNQFKANIDSGRDTSVFTYFMYFLLLFLSLFFVYSFLYYALWVLFIVWLFVIIRNRF